MTSKQTTCSSSEEPTKGRRSRRGGKAIPGVGGKPAFVPDEIWNEFQASLDHYADELRSALVDKFDLEDAGSDDEE